MRRNFVFFSLILGAVACVVHADDDCSYAEDYVCYLEYTPGYGYERVCEWTVDPLVCVDFDDDDYYDEGRPSRYHRPASSVSSAGSTSTGSAGSTSTGTAGSSSGSAGGSGGSAGNPSGGSAGSGGDPSTHPNGDPQSPPAEPGSDIPCSRDGQCGTGLCVEGECFYGCEADADCGTGDICAVVTTCDACGQASATSVCQAADEPVVECTRTAECGNAQICLNATCHESCETTADCTNPLDRCESSVCVPDRSVVSECLLDRECGEGQVCIDATCQER